MSVKYTNFVEVNINHHVSNKPTGLRDVAVAIFYDSTIVEPNTVTDCGTLTKTSTLPDELTNFENYVDAFFDNGGRKLHCIVTNVAPRETVTIEGQSVIRVNANFTVIIDGLPMEEIMVGYVGTGTLANEVDFREAAAAYNESKATEKIYQKIFVAEIPYVAGNTTDLSSYISSDEKVVDIENYVLKYGAMGIGASVLAYYTQMNAYLTDSAVDYCYTKEKYGEETTDHFVFNDNALVKEAMQLDINIDINLSNAVRNIGGNDTAGYSITNQFMLLVMHQTLTVKLYELLAQKIKYNSQGLTSVLSTLTAELNKYVNNGFLTTNKTWNDGDLYYENYLIIKDETLLSLGYKVVILPFESLSAEEVEAHQLPKIYVLVADSYSIRKIVVTGEVF